MKNQNAQHLDGKILLAHKRHIHHKVEMGVLFDAFYDTETTDLNKRFAEITQFGGAISDLAGNILHTADLRGRVSPYAVISPYAWLVQRMRYEDLARGDSRYIFAGKIQQFFRYASNLHQAPYAQDFLSVCREGSYKKTDGSIEKYFSYPVLDDDLSVDWDYLRIHEGLRKFYFKRPGTDQWVKRDIKAMTVGYNNINADDQWIWSAMHMAASGSIFPTHLADAGKFRLDGLRVVEAAVIAGLGGENRVRAPLKTDPRTGEQYFSFSQGAILEENTQLSSELRGILEGITLADGSFPDLTQLHGALPDALALSALMHFVRLREPEIMRQMEMNSDWKAVVDRLTENSSGFGNNPVLAYVDKSFPVVDGKMITLIGTDQYRNNPKVALVYNLGIDPKTYRYNGKSLEDLSAHDWAQIIRAARHNPNAPVKVIKSHHSPRLLGAEIGYARGFNLGLDRTELAARSRYLAREHITEKAMAGLRIAYPRLHGPERLVLPQPEEELFTFSTLELYDADVGEDIQVNHRLQNKIEEIAQKSRTHAMKIKGMWLEAMQPDEDILLNENAGEKEASAFIKKISDMNKKLVKEGGVIIPDPDVPVVDTRSALIYKLKILFYARNHFLQGNIRDIGHHFWFEDANGLKIPEDDVVTWHSSRIEDAWKSGNLNIRHEETGTMVLIIDRIIEDLGFAHILGPDVCGQLNAYKALRQAGLPHNRGEGDRWCTVGQALKDIDVIEQNEIPDKDIRAIDGLIPGAWEIFMTQHHDALAGLSEYRRYIGELSSVILSPRQLVYVGLNPKTGYPRKSREYEVNPDNALIALVPDRYLETPVIDPIRKRPLWILPLRREFNSKALSEVGEDVLLQAAGTGKMWHLPRAKIVEVPARGGAYADFYRAVEVGYTQSGKNLPPNEKVMALIGNGPYPLFDLRGPENLDAQSLKLPKHLFEGLIAPQLASFRERPQGIIIRDEALRVETGPVRLLEVDEKKGRPTGWEFGRNIRKVSRVALSDIEKMIEKDLEVFGFSSKEQALDYFSDLFTCQQLDPRNDKNKALAIVFEKIAVPTMPESRERVFYYAPTEEMVSCTKMDCFAFAEELSLKLST